MFSIIKVLIFHYCILISRLSGKTRLKSEYTKAPILSFTVVPKLNQGTIRQWDVIDCRYSFPACRSDDSDKYQTPSEQAGFALFSTSKKEQSIEGSTSAKE